MPDTTAGERKLFDLFRNNLPDTCIVRYEVLLGERDFRPDYTLIDRTRGVLIVEVKDWSLDHITQATTEQFLVRGNRGNSAPKPSINPNRKCEIYLRHAREQLVAMPPLRNQDDGRLTIAPAYFVALPNISRQEFTERGFDKLLPTMNVLLREDLAGSGTPFVQRYEECLPPLVKPLTDEQLDAIVAALLPDIAIPHVTPGFIQTVQDIVRLDTETISTYNLSLDQEQIAKSLGEGPRLLRGIAGTGKTLIMLYRAKMLAANSVGLRILILCWNVSLANYMQQAYEKLQFEAKGTVTILNFAQYAKKLFQAHGRDQCDPDRPEFTSMLQSLPITDADCYDAIYIDEAQDFRQEWIGLIYQRLLTGEPEKRNLLIAADDAQRIYHKRNFRWADLGIPMPGRSKILKTVYRNSARVWMFAAFLLEDKATYVRDDHSNVQFSTKGGYDPLVEKCETPKAQIDKAVQTIHDMQQAGFAFRNVLILYKSRTLNRYPIVDRLLARLEKEAIPCDWITEKKSTFDWHADTVKISTVHSAKGMDCPVVIILGAEGFNEGLEGEEDDIKLLYVAMTRAREFLMILYSEETGLVPAIHHCEREYQKYLPLIIQEENQDQKM